MNGSGGGFATPDPRALLNSPTALALMAAQLMPNGQPNGHVQSPLFNGMPLVSSPSSSSTSSTPLAMNGIPPADPSAANGLCAICSDKATGRHYGLF